MDFFPTHVYLTNFPLFFWFLPTHYFTLVENLSCHFTDGGLAHFTSQQLANLKNRMEAKGSRWAIQATLTFGRESLRIQDPSVGKESLELDKMSGSFKGALGLKKNKDSHWKKRKARVRNVIVPWSCQTKRSAPM